MGLTREDYLKLVDSSRKTIFKKVEDYGWESSVDDIGIILEGLKLTCEIWQFGLDSYVEYSLLEREIIELREHCM